MNNQSDPKLLVRVQDKMPGVGPARQTVTGWCVCLCGFSFVILHFYSSIRYHTGLFLAFYICG